MRARVYVRRGEQPQQILGLILSPSCRGVRLTRPTLAFERHSRPEQQQTDCDGSAFMPRRPPHMIEVFAFEASVLVHR